MTASRRCSAPASPSCGLIPGPFTPGRPSPMLSGPRRASATKQRYGSKLVDVTVDADWRVRAFWRVFAEQFAWDFSHGLPVCSLCGLDAHGISEGVDLDPSRGNILTLEVIATAKGDGSYSRSRPGSLLRAAESLTKKVLQWSPDGSGTTPYGLCRSSVQETDALQRRHCAPYRSDALNCPGHFTGTRGDRAGQSAGIPCNSAVFRHGVIRIPGSPSTRCL